MFMQYRKDILPYRSTQLEHDERLEIVYPTADHATVLPGQDFYVIGQFHGMQVPEDARLTVILETMGGTPIRTVETMCRDNTAGIMADYPGLLTVHTPEEIRHAGMPDLVCDPHVPESIWYTWNKAYYTNTHFSALIYGGTYDSKRIHPMDQFGVPLRPIEAGEYRLSVELRIPGETIRSSMTLRVQEGTKEIVLSRYTSKEHSAVLDRFVKENGFERYTDPHPGMWNSASFGCGWDQACLIEIPDRWQYSDAMEYQSGVVHCFDYHLSRTCVGYRTEIGAILAKDASCIDDLDRMRIYYYRNGRPQIGDSLPATQQFGLFQPNEYLAITDAFSYIGNPCHIQVQAVLKPIPSAVQTISQCTYHIESRLETLQYRICLADTPGESVEFSGCPVGMDYETEDGNKEFFPLHASHRLELPQEWYGKEVQITVSAADRTGRIWDTKTVSLRLGRQAPELILCDVDGTLIDSTQRITPAFDELKALLKQYDLPFTIASGRSPALIREYADYLELDRPALVNNGASAVDQGAHLWYDVFPAHLIRDAIVAADKMDMAIFMCFDGDELCYRHNAYIQREIDEYGRYNRFYIPLASEWDALQFERVMITDPERPGRIDSILPLLEGLRDRLTILRYDDRHVDVMKKGVSKGNGIRRLAAKMGVDPLKMMVIGDGVNDIEMMREVGMGVAVGNASPILKEAADYVCEARNTYGVIEALRRFSVVEEN